MIKRTLFFAQPCRLTVKDRQLVASYPDGGETRSAPVEDLGFVVIENQQISISMPLLTELTNNNVAVVFCNSFHYPSSMLLNLDGHHIQQELFSHQVAATEPLKKNLWKQTVEAKIRNQAGALLKLSKDYRKVLHFADKVKSGDPENVEGSAARIYWPLLFGSTFTREQHGDPPNNLLNYGYAIIRAAVARALAGSGLLATLGIHHHNKYNAFCLADDIMEPYRPYVDLLVHEICSHEENIDELKTELKLKLLEVLACDVRMGKQTRPLMIGLSSTTASLAKCFAGTAKKLNYPLIN
ncbi:MAG: type II CRISPR-associated endonuclease Cas1 [Bacteroidales bacterium]|nr:type II CRISPR-associated endonuclease Cas1 [Bacteroidales bacterium]